ncbi:MAG TPA: protein kinase [Gemmatimonadaceae bacterium]
MSDTLRDRAITAFGEGYELDAEIGRGGMGVVYRCKDVKLRRFVAIKVLPPDLAFRDEVRTRFLREAETAAQLNHPNIVPIFSVDDRDGLVWFVMGLVDGESLAARLVREPRPPFADVRRILREVADALAYAHARGIIHRDIKPDNILLDRLTGRPIVTDFGIARAIEGDSRLTVTGTAVGTPAYMSPEQAMGEGEIDGRSDLYSLAVVGYQMLAGELPFKASNTPAMLMKHLSDPLRPLRTVQPDVPRQLAALIERTLAKKPHQRWRDATEFRDALDAVSVSGAPETVSPAGHASAAWKRPAVPPPPLPARFSPAHDDPPVRLPRLSNPSAAGHREIGGTSSRDRSLARRPSHRAEDDSHGNRPPVPSFMPDSWHDARSAWGRREERGGKRSRESRIRDFRQHLARTGVMVATLGTVNLMFSPGFLWFLFPTAFFGLGMLRRAGSLWADGIRVRDVFGPQASEQLARGEVPEPSRSSRPPSVNELARQLAPADVLAGPYGDSIRRAASDRAAAREALARLAPPDREMIPDVAPTLDALAERVSSLAQALHGLEKAAPADAIASVDKALAEARTRPESAERDRRVEMLERQRETIADLTNRREGLKEQLENANLLLQSMRLDLLALGSAGVQSAINDSTSATQEARALSRDLRIALDAAKQIRTGA